MPHLPFFALVPARADLSFGGVHQLCCCFRPSTQSERDPAQEALDCVIDFTTKLEREYKGEISTPWAGNPFPVRSRNVMMTFFYVFIETEIGIC